MLIIKNLNSNFLFQSIIFLDMEGTPIQEISALEVDIKTKAIVDVFHYYGDYNKRDKFARQHVHGLNKFFLKCHSSGNEAKLIESFLLWLKPKNVRTIYANNPVKEAAVLKLPIVNFPLPIWVERQHKRYHRVAIFMKNTNYPICQIVSCSKSAHSSFINSVQHRNPEITLAKEKHGYHCSLYDVMELYLFYYDPCFA